jgi:SNF family Na+-dependent transporter
MASVETTITSILDVFPKLKLKPIRKKLAITVICFVYFLCGIIFCLQSGTYWVEIFNNYAGDWAVLLVGALECISISWFYGVENFKKDIRIMIGMKHTNNFTYYIWCALWWVISPGLLIILVALLFRDLKKISLPDYVFPDWTHVLGFMMTASVLAGLVLWSIVLIIDSLFISKKV